MDNILSVAGITTIIMLLATLVFQYFPNLRVKWAKVATERKKLIILGLYIGVGAFVAFGGCAAFLIKLFPGLMCVAADTFFQYIAAVLVAVGSGQGVFGLLPELKDVQAAKSERAY